MSHLVKPGDGRLAWLGGMGVRFMLGSDATGGRVAVVEHPLAPRALAAPMHRDTHEDETSFVLGVISPGGFESSFAALADADEPTPDAVRPTAERYGLEVDPSTIAGLCERHGLVFGPPPAG